MMGPVAAYCVCLSVFVSHIPRSSCGHHSMQHTWSIRAPLLQPNDPARGVEGCRNGGREIRRGREGESRI